MHLMTTIKRTLDPSGILNPGKVLDVEPIIVNGEKNGEKSKGDTM